MAEDKKVKAGWEKKAEEKVEVVTEGGRKVWNRSMDKPAPKPEPETSAKDLDRAKAQITRRP